MNDEASVLALVGSYRKGGTIDSLVDEVLASAQKEGAHTRKIYLIDKQIEFCTNCRTCTQEPGANRGTCIHHDDMEELLDAIEAADALILGSPMNFGTVTAVTKRFIERLVCLAYWPWGKHIPKPRIRSQKKPSVIIASCSAPTFFLFLSPGMRRLMRDAIKLVGGKIIGEIRVGMAAKQRQPREMEGKRKQARHLGHELVARLPAQAPSVLLRPRKT